MSRSRTAPCNACGGQVVFFRSPHSGSWMPFDPKPIDRAAHQGITPYPIENERAWKTRELVEDLMVRHQQSRDEAEREVNDMPWHVPHRCPNRIPEEDHDALD